MSHEQPFGDQPNSVEQYIINETTILDEDKDNKTFASWEVDASTIKSRAISRGDHQIRAYVLQESDFEFYKEGERFWYEGRTNEGFSIRLSEQLGDEDHVLVIEHTGNPESETEVTVQAW